MKKLISYTLFATVLGVVGCDKSNQTEQTEQTGQTTVETVPAEVVETATSEAVNNNPDWPTYIVATDPSNAPFEQKNAKGIVEGFDVDLIQAIAKAEKFNVDIIPQSWAGIFDSLNSGERDILIAPLTINPERDELVDFTIPYIYPTRTAYMLPETAEKLGIHSYQDLTKAKVAAKKATTNISSLEDSFGSDIKIIPVDSQYLALTAVTSGKADVGFGDTAVLKYHSDGMTDIDFVTIEQPLDEPVAAGFSVKNGNSELLAVLNQGIKDVVTDGTYRQLAIKWFGDDLGNQIADRTEQQMKNN